MGTLAAPRVTLVSEFADVGESTGEWRQRKYWRVVSFSSIVLRCIDHKKDGYLTKTSEGIQRELRADRS